MPPQQRNQFLDAEESADDGSQGYDSEADELRKGRTAKRRKVDSDEEGDDDDDLSDAGFDQDEDRQGSDGDDDDDDTAAANQLRQESLDISTSQQAAQDQLDDDKDDAHMPTKNKDSDSASQPEQSKLPGMFRPLSKKNLIASETAVKKSGVLYISRLPPFMKPQKLRSLLEPHGAINRIFAAPEDPSAHARRVRAGGNKKKSYTEAWVEFVRKKDAKRAVDLLNAQTIGGKKGSYYRDDIWTLRYLQGFKWHHLTEQISAENAERASRMRAEIAKTTRENKEFVRNVEQAKVLDGMRSKREQKREQQQLDGGDDGGSISNKKKRRLSDGGVASGPGGDEKAGKKSKKSGDKIGGGGEERTTTFKQIPLVDKKRKDRTEQPEQVQRVLSKIF